MISYDFRFNSKLVRLKGKHNRIRNPGLHGFNSKLVRLKVTFYRLAIHIS